MLENIPNAEEKKELRKYFQKNYEKWFMELRHGFNLLFYGVGSKKGIVEEFVTKCCLDGPQFIIHGFSPTISIKEILLRISQEITGKTTSLHRDPVICAQKITSQSDKESKEPEPSLSQRTKR